jgi:hypothetical protein
MAETGEIEINRKMKFVDQIKFLIKFMDYICFVILLLFIFVTIFTDGIIEKIFMGSSLILIILIYIIPFRKYLKYFLDTLEKNNGWENEYIQTTIFLYFFLFTYLILAIILIYEFYLFNPFLLIIILIGFSIFIIIIILFINKDRKNKLNWESKSFKNLQIKDTIKRIENLFTTNKIEFKKVKFKKPNKFHLWKYDYSYELLNQIFVIIFFPDKKKQSSKTNLDCLFYIGSLDHKKKKIFEKYKKLIDNEFDE